MSINSRTFVEVNVPLVDIERTNGFFTEIGWNTRPHTAEPASIYVHPLERGQGPVIAYWHTNKSRKLARFVMHEVAEPSQYSVGLWHPVMQETTEVVLIVPNANTVEELADRGGSLLAAHTHQTLREHAGALEFRFTDPYNNALRVTHFDDYEL